MSGIWEARVLSLSKGGRLLYQQALEGGAALKPCYNRRDPVALSRS
jgi:hypothetical protein